MTDRKESEKPLMGKKSPESESSADVSEKQTGLFGSLELAIAVFILVVIVVQIIYGVGNFDMQKLWGADDAGANVGFEATWNGMFRIVFGVDALMRVSMMAVLAIIMMMTVTGWISINTQTGISGLLSGVVVLVFVGAMLLLLLGYVRPALYFLMGAMAVTIANCIFANFVEKKNSSTVSKVVAVVCSVFALYLGVAAYALTGWTEAI